MRFHLRSSALVGYLTMIRRDFFRIIRIWAQTLLPPVITSALYFAIFGGFIGSQVGDIDGFSYMQFIVPGLIMMNMLMSAYNNTLFTFYFAKWMHTIDEILVSPMPNWVVIAGYLSGGIVRAALTGVLVTAVALFFTDLPLTNMLVLLAAAFLVSLAFALGGIINSIYAKSFDSMMYVSTFALTPLTYLGGVFYSINFLPEPFRSLSLFNPILYMINAFRYGFLGITDIPLWQCFAVIIAFTAVMFVWTLWLFKKGAGLKR